MSVLRGAMGQAKAECGIGANLDGCQEIRPMVEGPPRSIKDRLDRWMAPPPPSEDGEVDLQKVASD
jgi:hypothetical protein